MKVDRSILSTNDQQYGQVADPNKIENMIKHLADVSDTNDEAKTDKTGDHPGTWRGLTPGQVGEGINGGRLDVLEPKVANIEQNYAKKQQPAVQLVTLQNGWLHEDYNGLVYRKNEFGDIELDGNCYGGVITGNTTIGQIPLEILPAGRQIMLQVMGRDVGGTVSVVSIWIHANTREIKLYGSGQRTLTFDGVVIRRGV